MIDFGNREEITNKLKELKAKNLPHMTIEQLRVILKMQLRMRKKLLVKIYSDFITITKVMNVFLRTHIPL